MKTFSPKITIIAVLALASVNLASCGSGGDAAIENATEETSVQKAPALEFCARSENAGNLLCQLVATEIKIEFPGGHARLEHDYDAKGRLVKLTAWDQNNAKDSVITFAYDEHGLRFQETHSDPDPNDPQKFTYSEAKTLTYNPDGSLLQTKSEKKTNGTLTSTLFDDYLYGASAAGYSVLVMSRETEPSGNTTFSQLNGIRKDENGKTLLEDKKTLAPGAFTLTYWEKTSYSYDPQNGRLRSYRTESQDCTKNACGSAIAAMSISIMEVSVNEAGKIGKFVGTSDGDINQNQAPDGVPDTKMDCSFGYDNAIEGAYAFQHPMMNMIGLQVSAGYNLDFRVTDNFTKFTCPVTANADMTMTFTQTRLWQAIGAPAPGGSGS